MHDAARLERQGIPSVVVAWDTFEVPARIQAKVMGLPDLPIVVVPHNAPGDFTREAESRKAEASVEIVVAALTGAQPVPARGA